MEKVDCVIAYVDNNDSVWQKTYFDYCFKINQRIKIVEMMQFITQTLNLTTFGE